MAFEQAKHFVLQLSNYLTFVLNEYIHTLKFVIHFELQDYNLNKISVCILFNIVGSASLTYPIALYTYAQMGGKAMTIQ